ncbi:MAG: hypothetical protein JWR55_1345 [Aeromicrobium sp.]|nr:hypothetical protein [Aeromicrobium sp.]
MNGAQLTVACLEAEGVTHVAGVPGTTNMDILDALHEHPTIRYLSTRHEQAAAALADGYGRASGAPAVCIGSRGPGMTNMATFIANAHDESVPLVAIAGQVSTGVRGRAAFEELEVLDVFASFTKAALEVHEADRIPEVLQRAFRLAVSGRPGPVLVSIPLDVQRAPTTAQPHPRVRFRRPAPHPDDLSSAVGILSAAERPLLMVGGGVGGRTHDEAVVALAEAMGGPVVTTWLRKDRFPNDHPQFVGTLGAGVLPVTDDAVRECDVLVALGCRFSEFSTQRWTLISPGTRIVHVDVDPDELGHVYVPELGVHADAHLFADALAGLLSTPSTGGPWLTTLRHRYEEARRLVVEPDDDGVSMSELTAAVSTVVDRDGTTLVMDAPSTGTWIQRHLIIDRPGAYLASAGGAMGWGLPAAMGVQLARPGDKVVCLSGDGSFWMVAADFETCVRENIPVVVVVSNNFAYGNTRDRQLHAHDGRYIGVFYDNGDLAEYAKLLGGHGERVTEAADLGPALERALASGRPAVVDVVQGRHAGLPADLQPLPAK